MLDCMDHKGREKPKFCTYDVDHSLMKNLGLNNYTAYMFYEWINENLYNPLGYKMYKKFTFPDIFNQLLNISKINSMIHPEMKIPHYQEFLDSIVDSFGQIEEYTS